MVRTALSTFGTFNVISGMYSFGDKRLESVNAGSDTFDFTEKSSLSTEFPWNRMAVIMRPEIRNIWMTGQASLSRSHFASRPPQYSNTVEESIWESQDCRSIGDPGQTKIPLPKVQYFLAKQNHWTKRYGFRQGWFGAIRTRRQTTVEVIDLTPIFGHEVTDIRISRLDTYLNMGWRWYELNFYEHGGPGPVILTSFVPGSLFDAITRTIACGKRLAAMR